MRIIKKLAWRINQEIRSPEIRLLGEDGKQIGVVRIEEARNQAREQQLDLIEIAPNAQPPVVKLANLGKFLYQEEKRKKKEEKKQKGGGLKEIWFSPFIGEHDYETRIKRIREFLEEKNKVKLGVEFKGRQMGSKQFGYDLIKRIVSELGEGVTLDAEPKFLGRNLTAVISPVSKKKETQNVETKA